jgi:hypothetical protein
VVGLERDDNSHRPSGDRVYDFESPVPVDIESGFASSLSLPNRFKNVSHSQPALAQPLLEVRMVEANVSCPALLSRESAKPDKQLPTCRGHCRAGGCRRGTTWALMPLHLGMSLCPVNMS